MNLSKVTSWLTLYAPPFFIGVTSRLLLYIVLVFGGEMPLGISIEHARFFRYDALWHWEIMQNGYGAAQSGNTLVTHYSLVWPLIMSLASFVLGDDKFRMMLLNCVLFGITASAVAKMSRVAGLPWWKPVAFLCCFPTAFFANSVYNEPIFMLATVMSVAFSLEKKPLGSGIWASVGVAIRVNGWAQAAAWILSTIDWKKNKAPLIAGTVAILLASSIQPLAIWYWRGSPTAHYKDLQNVEWMASPQLIPFREPVKTVALAIGNPALLSHSVDFMFYRGWSAVAIWTSVLVLIFSWKRLPRVVRLQGLFTIIGLGLLEQAISLPRYIMAFIPFYFVAARLPAWALGSVCSLMAWTQLYLATRFVRGLWSF